MPRTARRPRLRWVMLVPTLLTITVGFTVFGVYVDRIEHRSRLADVDAELVRAERAFVQRRTQARSATTGDVAPTAETTAAQAPDTSDVLSPVRIVVWPDGRADADVAPNPFDAATVALLAERPGVRTLDEPRYRARTGSLRDGRVLVTALPLATVDRARTDFRRALLAGGTVIVAVQALVIGLLTAGVVRPVTRMTRAAGRIADGALATAVGPPSGSRETAELAVDLERMLTRLRGALDDAASSAVQAAEARDDLRRFLADVAHEIRTPLTALRGYSALYERGMLREPEALDRAMGRIGQESGRLHGLVDDMLRLTRDQRPVATVEVFDVVDVVHDVVADLRSVHPERLITVDAGPAGGHRSEGTPASVHQAILNVVGNACQHTPAGSSVEVTVRSDADEVTIGIADHGPGIDDADADRVFLPFFQLDPSRSRATNAGAGLGLALTRQIVDHHHGSIAVTRTPGGGSTFTITLPRRQPPPTVRPIAAD